MSKKRERKVTLKLEGDPASGKTILFEQVLLPILQLVCSDIKRVKYKENEWVLTLNERDTTHYG